MSQVNLKKRQLLAGAAGLGILLVGYGTLGRSGAPDKTALAAANAPSKGGKILRIGYQKGGALNILRLQKTLEKRLAPQGVAVQWLNFPAGPQLLEAIGVDSVDIGSTGDAPAVFAQAAGNDLVYVANNPPNAAGDDRAILVPKDSPIRTVADLKGKRIAVQKGSGTHNFLVQALEKAGVKYTDVKPVYLAPPDARPAFDSGSVDAWAIWNPYLAIAQKTTGARAVINGAGIVSAGGFYLSSRKAAREKAEWIRALLEEVDKTGRWTADHPHEAAVILAPSTGLDVAVLEEMQRRSHRSNEKYVGFRPIDETVIKAQQTVADNFLRIGLLPKKVDVRKGVLTPTEYAALTPDVKLARNP